MKKADVTLIASRATDTILDNDGNILQVQEGGPAYFMERVFRDQGVLFNAIIPEEVEVEIRVSSDSEIGRVVNPGDPVSVSGSEIATEQVVVSTIAQEISIEKLSDCNVNIFLDIQGFVRDGKNFGAKRKWSPSAKLLARILCMKATVEELKYLDVEAVERQKEKILLVTMGSAGTTIFIKGEEHLIRPERVVSARHTLGAGDTLFAYFIVFFLANNDPIASLKKATMHTSNFLLKL